MQERFLAALASGGGRARKEHEEQVCRAAPEVDGRGTGWRARGASPDGCNTSRPRRGLRRSQSESWSRRSTGGSGSGGGGGGGVDWSAEIGAAARAPNQFRASLHFPRHKHSSPPPPSPSPPAHELNNKLAGRGREHITSANNSADATTSATAYRRRGARRQGAGPGGARPALACDTDRAPQQPPPPPLSHPGSAQQHRNQHHQSGPPTSPSNGRILASPRWAQLAGAAEAHHRLQQQQHAGATAVGVGSHLQAAGAAPATCQPAAQRHRLYLREEAPGTRRTMELLCADSLVAAEHRKHQSDSDLANNNNNNNRHLPTQSYPNNTHLADLAKCHASLARGWPKQGWLGARLRGCWRRGAKFRRLRFHLPEPLLQSNVSITHDDYDRALSVLTGDVRYQLHLLLYRRAQPIWLLFTTLLCLGVALLLAGPTAAAASLAGPAAGWLALQLVGALATSKFRRKLDQMLEKAVAQVNSYFMEHNLMLGVINRGHWFAGQSKFLIPMLYFDTAPCREHIESILGGADSRRLTHAGNLDNRDDTAPLERLVCNGHDDTANQTTAKHILDYSKFPGPPPNKPNQMGLAQSQLAKKIVLRYSQRWISLFDKRKLMFTDDQVQPRHLSTGKCLCQFIEEHLCPAAAGAKQQQQQQPEQHLPATITWDNCKPPESTITMATNKPRSPKQDSRKQVSPAEATNQQVCILMARDSVEPDINKRHTSTLQSYMLVKPTTGKLSGLSRIVMLRERRKQKRHRRRHQLHQQQNTSSARPLEATCQSVLAQADHKLSSLGYLNGLLYTPPYAAMEPLEGTGGNLASPSSQGTGSLAATDLSLEMDTDSISRSDELVRKLRLLLELKKDEIQSLEGPLFSAAWTGPKESPPSTLTSGSRQDGTSDKSLMNSNILAYQETGNGTGKKMNLQRYGLFFLGASGTKKTAAEVEAAARKQALEMC